MRVLEQGPPWDAIGQVNVEGYRIAARCTGTLVAPDIVLTAAHCVMDPWRKTPFPLHDIHFLAGVRGAERKGHATAKCLQFQKNYEFVAPEKILPTMLAQKVPLSAFATDVVAMVLNEKLAVDPAPLADGVVAQPGLRLVPRSITCRSAVCSFRPLRLSSSPVRPRRTAMVQRLRYAPGKLRWPRVHPNRRGTQAGRHNARRGPAYLKFGPAHFGMEGPDTRHRLPLESSRAIYARAEVRRRVGFLVSLRRSHRDRTGDDAATMSLGRHHRDGDATTTLYGGRCASRRRRSRLSEPTGQTLIRRDRNRSRSH